MKEWLLAFAVLLFFMQVEKSIKHDCDAGNQYSCEVLERN